MDLFLEEAQVLDLCYVYAQGLASSSYSEKVHVVFHLGAVTSQQKHLRQSTIQGNPQRFVLVQREDQNTFQN